ncbi:MAG: ABC transporter substrate-binding protein [Anaerolineae bacterium]|nr:ABC transporter substrate-binding protein [Anaerolineae bacterium]
MKRRLRFLLLGLVLAAFLFPSTGCRRAKGPSKAVLSLDWVPNTNHTGFYVALEKGWYKEEGIDLEIQIPSDPAAALKQVAAGNTEFGVSFQEEVTIARAKGIPVVSIAAIIQHNTSAFAALKSSGITRPADFEGKTYASYGLPIERPIIAGLMKCDGADVNKVKFVDVGFDAFPALLSGKVDFAWIFLGWDGIQAQLKGVELNTIPLYGSCIPDYYTPLIITGEKTLKEKGDLVRRFLAATSRGYRYAIEHPEEAAEILLKHSPESDPALVKASQAWLSPRYQDDAPRWGEQKREVWANFAQWLYENGLLSKKIDPDKAFTNDYLPK